ncbi:BspA family leucine-rich repeat surface protein [Aquiflexum sp. TKW24L]|uniref:BspA family leucine-rich repeat surface protein n=1 Tax=Aquiflexum sp. TKW24L TaxID=2942212 RepID=UPI0020BF9E01|nr:BspA family leucine-rich repeat surface protein [Aquiflexum sp. TKW24L]MCL6259840.1 BspA family leucine-rich repeat surface protein [Aquiflexum sp. TKW24L]
MKTLKLFPIILFTTLISCVEETVYLIMSASPAEGGHILSSATSGLFEKGQSVTLTAVPYENWEFQRWEGDGSGTANPLTLTMNANKNIQAIFTMKDISFEYTILGEGTVTERIVENPSGRQFPHGTMVELTPVPKEGWVFESWVIEDIVGTKNRISNENPKTISIDGRNFLKWAIFVRKPQGEARFVLAENGITCKCENVISGQKGTLNGVEFEAVDNELLRQKVDEKADLTKLCTSLVTDMRTLFWGSELNQRIGNWDVSKVTDMSWMFLDSKFNQPIGSWDVSSVIDMEGMFALSSEIILWDPVFGVFNQPIGDWDVSKVTNMDYIFWQNQQFNQDLSNWCVANIPKAPKDYSNSAWTLPKPVWGTCPD